MGKTSSAAAAQHDANGSTSEVPGDSFQVGVIVEPAMEKEVDTSPA